MTKNENSKSKGIFEKYLEALRQINDWTTVSDWAIKVTELYPEILEDADKQAKRHKRPSTGLREIAARISSRITTDRCAGKVEVDESERPKRVRILSFEEATNYSKNSLEADLEPLTRVQKIKAQETKLGTKEKYRLAEFDAIIGQLRDFFNLDFEFEHAKAILNPTDPGEHHPDNIQLLLKSHNRLKGNENWIRFTFKEQVEYIEAVIRVQKLVSKKMGVELQDEVIKSIIERLKLVY